MIKITIKEPTSSLSMTVSRLQSKASKSIGYDIINKVKTLIRAYYSKVKTNHLFFLSVEPLKKLSSKSNWKCFEKKKKKAQKSGIKKFSFVFKIRKFSDGGKCFPEKRRRIKREEIEYRPRGVPEMRVIVKQQVPIC